MESRRSAVLDGMRFLAAALIVLYHYCSEGPTPLEQVHPIFLRGYLATDFFLILSGYVLGRAYGRQIADRAISDGTFFTRRLARIWPGHLIVLAGFVVVVLGAGAVGVPPHNAEHFRWPALASQALLVQAWGPFGGGGWNMPSWSLSALIICYLAFPPLWRAMERVRDGGVLIVAGLGALLIGDAACRASIGRSLFDLPFEMGVIRALPLFFLGACAARAADLGWLAGRPNGWIAAACGVTVVALQFAGRFDFASLTLLGLMIMAAGEVRTQSGARVMAAAAQLSFALYITHILTELVWFSAERAVEARFSLSLGVRWGLWALSFPAALFVAGVFDRMIDQPVQRAVGGLLSRRRDRYRGPARNG